MVYQPWKKPCPVRAVISKQRSLAGFQRRPARVVDVQIRERVLQTNELAARVAALLQPVGVDQPQTIVVGVVEDRLDKGVGLVHGVASEVLESVAILPRRALPADTAVLLYNSAMSRNDPCELEHLTLPASGETALAALTDPVRRWFAEHFSNPTAAQRLAWPAIAAGKNLLLCAPTGTGKTLAAFLPVLGELLRAPLAASVR